MHHFAVVCRSKKRTNPTTNKPDVRGVEDSDEDNEDVYVISDVAAVALDDSQLITFKLDSGPTSHNRRCGYATSWCEGLHQARREKRVLARRTGRRFVIPHDIQYTVWEVPVAAHALRYPFGAGSFPEKDARTDRRNVKYRSGRR